MKGGCAGKSNDDLCRRCARGFFRRLKTTTIAGMLIIAWLTAAPLSADTAADIARIHLDAIGGPERVKALVAMRATGRVKSGRDEVRFTLLAARPDKVRLETQKGGRSLVQATDGEEPPWEFDTGTWPPVYRTMPAATAKTFAADAEFDDPLVTGAARGFVLEYAGEVDADGRKLLRVLVTRKLTDTFSLLIDPANYYIVKRVEFRQSVGGRKLQIVTHYEDFRAVEGVMLPHRVLVSIDGRLTQETQITKIEANPELKDDTFKRPKAGAATEKKS